MSTQLPAIQTQPQTQELITTINKTLEGWKKEGAHVLAPITLQNVPAMHRPVVVAVYIDPNPASKETYPQKGGGVSLSSLGWKKLADAMGIQWDPKQCGRTDNGQDPNRVEYRMVGRIKDLDGTWHILMGDKEIRMENVIEELTDSKREQAEKYLASPTDGPEFKRSFPDPEVWVREKVRQEALQIKKHLLSRAQSGAMSRAIKSKGIRETYTQAELQRPFVFPKLVAELDPNNPEDRAYLRAQAAGAMDQLYQPPQRTSEPSTSMLALIDEVKSAPPALEFYDVPDTTAKPAEKSTVAMPAKPAAPVSSAPSEAEALLADFKASDPKGQKEILQHLIERKGYAGKVTGDMAEWIPQQRAGFLVRLQGLPDKVKAVPQEAPLPFE